ATSTSRPTSVRSTRNSSTTGWAPAPARSSRATSAKKASRSSEIGNRRIGLPYRPMPPIKRTKFKLAPDQLLEMFYWLKLIRAFDLQLSTLVKQGKVRSGVYTGIGQEAIVVVTCFALRQQDWICPLHRDLGTILMKGVSARAIMSQMLAKETGLSKGRDSALHSGDNELGIFGNTSMLGANLPV